MSRFPLSIHAAGQEAPEQPFLITSDQQWTLEECSRLVGVLNQELASRDIHPGSQLAFRADNTPETLLLLLALMELRITAIPLHARWTTEECAELLREVYKDPPSKAVHALLEPDRIALFKKCSSEIPVEATEGASATRFELAPASGNRREDDASATQGMRSASHDEEELLAILHTSGSTGRPKGVKLSRRAFLHSAAASGKNLGWQPDDRWLLTLPVAHIGGLSILTRCLIARKAVVLGPRPSEGSANARAEQLLAHANVQRVTLMSLVPTQLAALCDRGSAPKALRAALIGGAATPPALVARALEQGWPILTSYGSTETCSQIVTQQPGTSAVPGSCGRALWGVELGFDGGRLRVRSPSLFSGYVGEAQPPLSDGWFLTNDLASLDGAGHLHIHGRADDVVISGGENINPAEVERALTQHPQIHAACVVGVAHPKWGQQVCAAVQLADTGRPTPTQDGQRLAVIQDDTGAPEQRAAPTESPPPLDPPIAQLLAPFARFKHPKVWLVVSAIEETPAGKVDRARMRKLFGAAQRDSADS